MSAKVIEFRPKKDVAKGPKPDPSRSPIKFCPFCGSAPKLVENQRVGAGSIDVAAYIVCSNEECSVMTPYFYKKSDRGFQDAIDAWNRRV